MVMINERAWLIGTRPTRSQHPGHHINIFTRKESTRTKSLIETADRLKCCPTKGKISPLNEARREKLSGTKVSSGDSFLDGNPVIRRIVEENSPTDEPEPRVFFEATCNRPEKIMGRITVVVGESKLCYPSTLSTPDYEPFQGPVAAQ
jgi:hypothetical protein